MSGDKFPLDLHVLCTVPEVTKQLKSLNPKKATGPDGVSATMLKEVATEIAPSLTRLFNLSLTSGRVPIEWKCSNVVPVPKNSEKSCAANYRPISLLTIVSKLLEKHMHTIILRHSMANNLISPKQWGFLPRRSTGSALLKVTSDWLQLLENKEAVWIVYFDLKKAFDTVPVSGC